MGLLLRKSRLSNKWAGQDSKRAPRALFCLHGVKLPRKAWEITARHKRQGTNMKFNDGSKALPDEISTALTISEAGMQEPCPSLSMLETLISPATTAKDMQ
jgi:hypothetical protein